MRSSITALCFFATALGCGREVVRLELPNTADARTLIIAIEHRKNASYQAVDLRDGALATHLPVVEPLDDEAHIELALYDETLEELGLAAGPITHEKERARGLQLPPTERYFETSVLEGRAVEWTPESTQPVLLKALRVRSKTELCARFAIEEIELPVENYYKLIIPDGDGVILSLKVRDEQALYRVSRSGVTKLAVFQMGLNAASAYRAANGDIYLGMNVGFLARWRVGEEIVPMSRITETFEYAMMRMVGPSDPNMPAELFVLTHDAGFHRYDIAANSWETIVEGLGEDRFNDPAGLLWIEPGHAVAVIPQRDVATSYPYYDRTPERLSQSDFPNLRHGRVVSMTMFEGRPLALTHLSHLVQLIGPTSTVGLEDVPVIADTSLIRAYEDGFLFFGGGLEIVQYKPPLGYCPTISTRTNVEPRAMTVLDDGTMVMSGDGKVVLFVTRLPPEE